MRDGIVEARKKVFFLKKEAKTFVQSGWKVYEKFAAIKLTKFFCFFLFTKRRLFFFLHN